MIDTKIPSCHRIALFASGAGSNAEQIIHHFRSRNQGAKPLAEVSCILCNQPTAFVVKRAARLGIECFCFDRDMLENGSVLRYLQEKQISFIALAGFLWRIPTPIIEAYPKAIVNIHPAILPNYGGKGMYGEKVHRAVIEAGEKQSGITIHYINQHYDEGAIVFQAYCPVLPDDTPQTLAERVHRLEYEHYPITIEKLLSQLDDTLFA